MNGRFDSFKIRCCEIAKQIDREARKLCKQNSRMLIAT